MADNQIIHADPSEWDEYDAWSEDMRLRLGDEAWEDALRQHALDARMSTHSAPGPH